MPAAIKAVEREELRLRGTPNRLLGVLRKAAPTGSVPVAIELPVKQEKVRGAPRLFAQIRPVGDNGLARARMRLPKSTPPGTYRGMAELTDGKVPVVVEVQANPHLEVLPEVVTLQASGGERPEICFTLVNGGNVPFEVPKAAAFGLFSTRGLAAAIGETFLAKLRRGERRLDRLMDELARGYGGVVKLMVRKGHGPLGQGEARDLGVGLHLPPGLVAGRRYWGDWPLEDAVLRVYVDVPQVHRPVRRKRPARRKTPTRRTKK